MYSMHLIFLTTCTTKYLCVQTWTRNTISLLFDNDLVYLKFSTQTSQNAGSLDDYGEKTGVESFVIELSAK